MNNHLEGAVMEMSVFWLDILPRKAWYNSQYARLDSIWSFKYTGHKRYRLS
jgi:hypothetical protein